MRPPRPVPLALQGRPFARDEALKLGLTSRQLEHRRFTRIHPSVYVETGTVLDEQASLRAAALALGPRAQVSHESRLFLEGFSFGRNQTWHFTIQGDDHIHHLDNVMVHRTVRMPPCDRKGVSLEHAFQGILTTRRVIDAVKAGDWLLHHELTSIPRIARAAEREPWRPGAVHVLHVLDLLDSRSASPMESEIRVMMQACGLPVPEINAAIEDADGELLGIGDLVLRAFRLVLEYEGRQHALDTKQFARDIDRYDGFRTNDWDYLQITHEMSARPKQLMTIIHQRLVLRGYGGPSPAFGTQWDALFRKCP